MADAAAKLAAEIADLKRRISAMERGQQFPHSTIDVGDEALTLPDALGAGVDALAASAELDSRLATAEGDLTASAARLEAAEADIIDAFGELGTVDDRVDAAKQAAIDAAAADATAKKEQAEANAALEAAAIAQQKADEAEAAALAAAQTYADAQASGASQAALDAAKADATAKANAAQAAAIQAAALDATAKKEQAEANAAADAAAKADAALNAAKADATSKANAAQAAAIQAAASDAQTKADAARKRAEDLWSLGTNLLERGNFETGVLYSNSLGTTALSTSASIKIITDASKARKGTRYLEMAPPVSPATSTTAHLDPIPVNPERTYRIGVWVYAESQPDAKSFGMPFYWLDANNSLINNTWPKLYYWADFGSKLTVGSWTYIYADIKPPANAVKMGTRFYIDSNATPSTFKARFDDVTVVDATEALAAQASADAAQATATAAQTAAGTAQTTANNALTMAGSKGKVFYDTAAPSGTGTAAGDLWRQIDASKNVIAEWYWTGSAWQSSQITTSAISNLDVGKLTAGAAAIQTLVSQKIAASTAAFQTVDVKNLFATSGTLDTAVIDKLWADVVNSRKINAGMLESQLVLSTEVIAGDPAGNHAKLDGNGFRVMAPPSAGADPVEVIRLGTETDDYFGVVGADGNLTASITAEGGVSAKEVNVADTLTLAGEDLGSKISYMPQRLTAWGQVPINTSTMLVNGAGEIGLFELGWDSNQEVGRDSRMYLFHLNNVLIRSTVAGQVGLRLRITTDGSKPTVNSPTIQYSYGYVGVANGYTSFNINRLIGSNNGEYIRVLVTLWNGGTGTASVLGDGNQTHLYSSVIDLGGSMEPTAIASTGGGTSGSKAPVTTTKEWAATGFKSYTGTGAAYNYNTGYMYSGLSPAGYGDLRSVAVFPSLTSTLTGATINDIWIYVYYDFWYYGGGGNAAISLHGHSTLPGSNPSLSFSTMSNSWPRAAGRWVRLPDSTYAGFKSGAWKGFALGGHGGGYTEYGYAHNPRIKIRYTV
ncbi:minor tail protein [Arthrobacter phage Kaylissa]|uniref:Minor tail protein n=1 Tax=Arthrobacter phage Kaylissa TaxID=2835951 RepID=A0AA92RVL4_9CAUD|nr:tail protein [Arthrobacter phage Kaylissa]QXO14554.1 minor tail protein [Arthrobacter phage Kaylissa]